MIWFLKRIIHYTNNIFLIFFPQRIYYIKSHFSQTFIEMFAETANWKISRLSDRSFFLLHVFLLITDETKT